MPKKGSSAKKAITAADEEALLTMAIDRAKKERDVIRKAREERLKRIAETNKIEVDAFPTPSETGVVKSEERKFAKKYGPSKL